MKPIAFFYLGQIAFRRSDHEKALWAYEEARSLYRQVGDVRREATCILYRGETAFIQSDHKEARQSFKEALDLYQQIGEVQGEDNCIKMLRDLWDE